ncbi:hypothetical protein LUZ60_006300 [Juncus effusus]|nr:hypothetical protein LUZ60_006300 [Juncus effusus]
MIPLSDDSFTRLYSQLELGSPASSQHPVPHPINFSFPYPTPTFILEGFQLPRPDQLLNDPMCNTIFDPSQMNNTTENPNSRSKRAGRKDRHSKIHTAMGLRDRRMRLSREVARKFFGLQDMLGFDKASKTVQWLLAKSKSAIKELGGASKGMHSNNGNSSPNNGDWPTSDCEDASTVSDNKHKIVSEEKKSKAKKSNAKAPRKSNAHQTLDKESRAKARERARERTKEKHRLQYWDNLVSSIGTIAVGGEESSSHCYTNYSSSIWINERSSSPVNKYNMPMNEHLHDCTIRSEPSEMLPFNYAGHENGDVNYNNVCTYQEQWEMEGAFFSATQYQPRPW